jgi:uncharacterized metal-binding protein YceD (DUF177 family)
MSGDKSPKTVFRVADLSQNKPQRFVLTPSADELTAIATDIDISAIRKLRFEGDIRAASKKDWQLTAKLGATVVQPCVVTLDPVTTRIDTEVVRHYLADFEDPEEEEHEVTEDENSEPLGAEIDVRQVMIESLALALPLYPRAENAEMDENVFTEPGKEAMTDEAARPFAGLAGLRDKLSGEDGK